MSLNLNIDNYGNKSVVPVVCGNIHGTAFFISKNQLLTAWHVVSGVVSGAAKIAFVHVEGSDIVCEVQSIDDDVDMALLTCVNFSLNDIEPIPLLACDFCENLDLEVIGYPQEIGNGIDYFGAQVRNSRHLSDLVRSGFDTVVVRTDPLGFYSYSGFSGSPVLDEFGHAIGVVTDQMYNSLGYTSMKAVVKLLRDLRINIEENDELYDTSDFGLGCCRKFISKAFDAAGSRYSRNFHVTNANFEKTMHFFCMDGIQEKNRFLLKEMQAWWDKTPQEVKDFIQEEQTDVFRNYLLNGNVSGSLLDFIEYFLDQKKKDSSSELLLHNPLRRDLRIMYGELSKFYSYQIYVESRYLYINGPAGNGKTHMLCHIAKEISMRQRVYMLFGTDFRDGADPIDIICDKFGWTHDGLDKLNNRLAAKQQYATFIIDALNEGAGTKYWQTKLSDLKTQFYSRKNLKLVVSVRQMPSTDILRDSLSEDWQKIDLNGFESPVDAMNQFFEHYHISFIPSQYAHIDEFQSPLFLSIFCNSYPYLDMEERKNPQRVTIYLRYLTKRNDNVCDIVDEDNHRHVVLEYIESLIQISVNDYRCGDLPRDLAKRISNRICRYRTWSNSLLYAMLKECLLMEYYSKTDGDRITFEYDSMGDFLKGRYLLEAKKDDDTVLAYLSSNLHYYQQNPGTADTDHFNYFLITFLSQWEPDSKVWKKDIFQKGELKNYLLGSLYYRNMSDDKNAPLLEAAKDILNTDTRMVLPETILRNFHIYTHGLILIVHERLCEMTMVKRDLLWTTQVNDLYDHYSLLPELKSIQTKTVEEIQILLQIKCWLLTSSYPVLRTYLIRDIKESFDKDSDLIVEIIDIFKEVDDPYVMQGILAAAYGSLLAVRKTDEAISVAKKIYEIYYQNAESLPKTLNLRHWSLLLLQNAENLNSEFNGWTLAKAILKSVHHEGAFPVTVPDTEHVEADNYFGTSRGSQALSASLFSLDFARYIIGTNSTVESRVFRYDKEHGVNLMEIAKAAAYIIKSKYGWNDKLGEYDSDVPYGGRFDQKRERIGKKYQWLSYHELLIQLCDTCYLQVDVYSSTEHTADINFPWYTERQPRFDPSLERQESLSSIISDKFESLSKTISTTGSDTDWVNDKAQLPDIPFIITDKTGEDWVVLTAYDNQTMDNGVTKRISFVHYQSVLVLGEHADQFKEWTKSAKNRPADYSMEYSGSIDFLWNEFPWADTYTSRGYGYSRKNDWNSPCDVWLSICAQLQEEYDGIEDEQDFLSTAYAPCEDMMRELHLYTAERGVIRSQDHEDTIVAINHVPIYGRMSGLIILRSWLNKYLENTGRSLFYFLNGGKEVQTNISIVEGMRLEGVYRYVTDGTPEAIQELEQESGRFIAD